MVPEEQVLNNIYACRDTLYLLYISSIIVRKPLPSGYA